MDIERFSGVQISIFFFQTHFIYFFNKFTPHTFRNTKTPLNLFSSNRKNKFHTENFINSALPRNSTARECISSSEGEDYKECKATQNC